MTASAAAITRRRPGWRRPRLLGILAAALVVAAGTYGLSLLQQASATPSAALAVPSGDPFPTTLGVPGVAAGLPAKGSIAQIDHSIAAWTKNLVANPHDFLSATNLAILYHGRGRLSADLGDQQKALTAIRTAVDIVPGSAGPRALEATILYTLHDFTGAFMVADAIYRADPSQSGALATRLDAELELGRIADARADLTTLRQATSGPAVDVRAARLAYVTGDWAGALTLARSALAAAASDEDADLGFFDYAVGEYERLSGDSAAARAAYADALSLRQTDLGALVGIARIDAYEGRTADAVAGLRKAAAIAPQPETVALLGDLLTLSDDAAGAKEQYATVRFIERLGEIQSTVFDRVLLRFELDHGGATQDVLVAARASLATRPDTTGHDVVAWALYRLGRYDEAATEIKAARSYGADDARLRFHDGAIELARGHRTAGQALLAGALRSGPALDPIERAEATRLLDR
jgi:tetratricopeptide (TPR) repeat protein